jgi:hypothetical protein
MVTNKKEHTQKTSGKQAPDVVIPKPMKIGASTPYDLVTFCYTSLTL